MSVSLIGCRTVEDLLEGIETLIEGKEIRRADEVRVDENDGGFCLSLVDRIGTEGTIEDGRVLVLTLQAKNDGTP